MVPYQRNSNQNATHHDYCHRQWQPPHLSQPHRSLPFIDSNQWLQKEWQSNNRKSLNQQHPHPGTKCHVHNTVAKPDTPTDDDNDGFQLLLVPKPSPCPPHTNQFFFVPQPKSDLGALYNAIQQLLESDAAMMTMTRCKTTATLPHPTISNNDATTTTPTMNLTMTMMTTNVNMLVCFIWIIWTDLWYPENTLMAAVALCRCGPISFLFLLLHDEELLPIFSSNSS